jgi:hypothetical protein
MALNLDLVTTETAANFAAVNYLHKAEFAKLPEGSTRSINGQNYYLKNSRWHSQKTGELLQNKIENADDDRSAAEEKASSAEARKERRELIASLQRDKPYSVKPVSGGYEVTIAHSDIDLDGAKITQAPSKILIKGDQVQIDQGDIEGLGTPAKGTSSTHAVSHNPIKVTAGSSQLQIHDALYHRDRGLLKKPDGKFAQFAKIPEGTKKGDKILKDSRWHSIDDEDDDLDLPDIAIDYSNLDDLNLDDLFMEDFNPPIEKESVPLFSKEQTAVLDSLSKEQADALRELGAASLETHMEIYNKIAGNEKLFKTFEEFEDVFARMGWA